MKNKKIKLQEGYNYQILNKNNSIVCGYEFIENDDYTIERAIVGNKVTIEITIINHVAISDIVIKPMNKRFLLEKYCQMIGFQKFYGYSGGAGSIYFNHLIDNGSDETFGFNGYNSFENDILDLSYGNSISSPSYNISWNLVDLLTDGITFSYTPNAIPEQNGDKRYIIIEGLLI